MLYLTRGLANSPRFVSMPGIFLTRETNDATHSLNLTARVKLLTLVEAVLKEASAHKSAITRASNVFVLLADCEKLHAWKNQWSSAPSMQK